MENQAGARGSGSSPGGSTRKWDPATKQLCNAIHLLVVCWSTAPGGPLLQIKIELEKYCDRPPFAKKVKAINSIISRDATNRTLSQMLSELAKANPIKEYKFDLLDAILASEGVASRFT
jgi:hypothetical protein